MSAARRPSGTRAPVRAGVAVLLTGLWSLVAAGPLVGSAGAATDGDVLDRVVKDSRIIESSGLAASQRFPGVLWTLNDSGNKAVLYAVKPSGATAAALRVTGVANEDWEAVASLRGAANQPLLAVGDIGDNAAARSHVEIDLVAEPASLRSRKVVPLRVLRLTYPPQDGPSDAEALLADPRDGRLYIITKGLLSGRLYAVPPSVWPGGAARGQLVGMARVPLSLVTDGAFLPDGRMLVRTYSMIAVLPAPEHDTSGTARLLEITGSPNLEQAESLAVLPGGRQAVVGSEGKDSPIWRIPVPGAPAQAPNPPTTSATRGGATRAGGAAAGSPLVGDGAGGRPTVLLAAVLAGLVGFGVVRVIRAGRQH